MNGPLDLAVGIHFPLDRLLKALGLEGARNVHGVTISADPRNIVTVTVTKLLTNTEVDAVIKEIETVSPSIETINVILKG